MKDEEGNIRTETTDVLEEGVPQDGVRTPEPHELSLKVVEQDRLPLRRNVDVVEVQNVHEPFPEKLPKDRGIFEGLALGDRQLFLGDDRLHLSPNERDERLLLRMEGRFERLVQKFARLRIEEDVNERIRRVDRIGHIHALPIDEQLPAHVAELGLDEDLLRDTRPSQQSGLERVRGLLEGLLVSRLEDKGRPASGRGGGTGPDRGRRTADGLRWGHSESKPATAD